MAGEYAFKCVASAQEKMYVNTSLVKDKSTFSFSVFLPEESTNKLTGYGEFAIRTKPNSIEPNIDGSTDGYIKFSSTSNNEALKLKFGEWCTYTVDMVVHVQNLPLL